MPRARVRLGMSATVTFKDLLESWRQSAAAPRTVATYPVRLGLDEAAQLAALAEMFPGRSTEQLVTELLSAALRELATAMPYVAGGRVISTDEHGDPVYEDVGPTPRFMELTRLHRQALEAPRQRRPRAKTLAKTSAKTRARKPRARRAGR